MQKTKHISLFAKPDEMRVIEKLMEATKRNTYSDLLRYLIMQEAEKILPRNARTNTNETKQTQNQPQQST